LTCVSRFLYKKTQDLSFRETYKLFSAIGTTVPFIHFPIETHCYDSPTNTIEQSPMRVRVKVRIKVRVLIPTLTS